MMVFLFFEKVDVYLLPDNFSLNAGIFLYIIYITGTLNETASFPVSASIYMSLKITVTLLYIFSGGLYSRDLRDIIFIKIGKCLDAS